MIALDASASLLALLRAARDFTRRAIGAEELERAAMQHAEARGCVSLLGRQARDTEIRELRAALFALRDEASRVANDLEAFDLWDGGVGTVIERLRAAVAR